MEKTAFKQNNPEGKHIPPDGKNTSFYVSDFPKGVIADSPVLAAAVTKKEEEAEIKTRKNWQV